MKLLLRIGRFMLVLFLFHSNQALSSLTDESQHLNKHLNAHGRQAVSKNKAQKQKTVKAKTKADAQQGNIWERIRAGLKFPMAALTLPDTATAAVDNNTPKAEAVLEKPRAHLNLAHRWLKYQPRDAGLMAQRLEHSAWTKQSLPGEKRKSAVKSSGILGASGHDASKQIIISARSGPSRLNVNALLQAKNDLSKSPDGSARIRSYLGLAKQKPALIKSLVATHRGPTSAGISPALENAAPAVIVRGTQREIQERINEQIKWYGQRPAYLQGVAERAQPYLYYIVEELSKHRLPMDLALLPIVESAYRPTAVSPKSAAGIWQFIPATGKDFKLLQNDYYDARFDIPSSTQAAIHFLTALKNHFNGDWLLALAAYNCGQAAVDSAISGNLAKGLKTDFWSLALPEETRDYVPKLLALATIFAHPSEYGLKLPAIKNQPFFVTVNITRAIDIRHLVEQPLTAVARLANLDDGQFMMLNPGYQSSVLRAEGPFTFHIPIAGANRLHRQLSLLEQRAKAVDNLLLSLAKADASKTGAGLFAFDIAGLDADKNMPALLPLSWDESLLSNTQAAEEASTLHYVDNSETLKTIAFNYNVSEESLRKANNFAHRQNVLPGQALVIPLRKNSSILFDAQEPDICSGPIT